jgi:hypothetical protein
VPYCVGAAVGNDVDEDIIRIKFLSSFDFSAPRPDKNAR